MMTTFECMKLQIDSVRAANKTSGRSCVSSFHSGSDIDTVMNQNETKDRASSMKSINCCNSTMIGVSSQCTAGTCNCYAPNVQQELVYDKERIYRQERVIERALKQLQYIGNCNNYSSILLPKLLEHIECLEQELHDLEQSFEKKRQHSTNTTINVESMHPQGPQHSQQSMSKRLNSASMELQIPVNNTDTVTVNAEFDESTSKSVDSESNHRVPEDGNKDGDNKSTMSKSEKERQGTTSPSSTMLKDVSNITAQVSFLKLSETRSNGIVDIKREAYISTKNVEDDVEIDLDTKTRTVGCASRVVLRKMTSISTDSDDYLSNNCGTISDELCSKEKQYRDSPKAKSQNAISSNDKDTSFSCKPMSGSFSKDGLKLTQGNGCNSIATGTIVNEVKNGGNELFTTTEGLKQEVPSLLLLNQSDDIDSIKFVSKGPTTNDITIDVLSLGSAKCVARKIELASSSLRQIVQRQTSNDTDSSENKDSDSFRLPSDSDDSSNDSSITDISFHCKEEQKKTKCSSSAQLELSQLSSHYSADSILPAIVTSAPASNNVDHSILLNRSIAISISSTSCNESDEDDDEVEIVYQSQSNILEISVVIDDDSSSVTQITT